jgi:signal transduction histidine kinase
MNSRSRAATRQRRWLRISWATLTFGLVVSLSLGVVWFKNAESQTRGAFDDSAGGVAASLTTALNRNADMAHSVAAMARSLPGLSNREFQGWYDAVGDTRPSGSPPIGFIRYIPGDQLATYVASHVGDIGLDGTRLNAIDVVPPGPRPYYCLVELGVWRVAEITFPSGLDYCALQPALIHNADNRSTAVSPTMTAASMTALGTLLGTPITSIPPQLQHMYFYSTPVYRQASVSPAPERSELLGWVGGFFNPQELLAVAVPTAAHLNVGLAHVNTPGGLTTVAPIGSRWTSPFHRSFGVAVDGEWIITISGGAARGVLSPWMQAGLLMLASIIANVLLFALLRVLASAESKAHALVDTRTSELGAANADRTQLLKGTLEVAERERTRLAAELHDGPIQRIAATGYMVDRAIRRLKRGDYVVTATLLDQVRHQLTEDTSGLRTVMTELRPPLLDAVGLVAALRRFAEAFAGRTGISAEVVDEMRGITAAPQTETTLYRVAQESLSNVDRHAGASKVRVTLRVPGPGVIELVVEDDGRGFETGRASELLREGHYGLAGMRERVEVADGTWTIESSGDAGTTITARLPLAAVELPDSELPPSLLAS